MLANLHSSVSIPQLVDANLQPVAELDGNGKPTSAAGISFQAFSGGPFLSWANAKATATSLTLYCPGYVPRGKRQAEHSPSHNIEYDITSSALVGVNRQFILATPGAGWHRYAGFNFRGPGLRAARVRLTSSVPSLLTASVMRWWVANCGISRPTVWPLIGLLPATSFLHPFHRPDHCGRLAPESISCCRQSLQCGTEFHQSRLCGREHVHRLSYSLPLSFD
jgi:hypothetical protein